MADASDLVQEKEEALTDSKGEALFEDVFGKDSELEQAKKRAIEKQKEKESKKGAQKKETIEAEATTADVSEEKPTEQKEEKHSEKFEQIKAELEQQKIVSQEEQVEEKPKKQRKPRQKKEKTEEEVLEKEDLAVDARKHRDAIKKLVLAKAEKALEEPVDEENDVNDFLEKNVVQEVSEEDLLKEQGTKEEGIKADANAVKKAMEKESEEVEAEIVDASSKLKPSLSFLQDEVGNVFIGRKASVFQKYGNEAALFVGRVSEDEFKDKNVSIDGLNPHVVFVCGARGSGKSYLLGIIAEELALKNQNVGVVVVDPVGVFWSMRFPNKDEKELESLQKWNMKPQGLENLRVFIPEGMKEKVPRNTYDATFSLPPALLTAEDWCLTFGIDRFSPSGLLLEKALFKVKHGYKDKEGKVEKPKPDNYSIEEVIKCLDKDSEINSPEKGYKGDSIRALSSRFDAAASWGIFEQKGTPLGEISCEKQLTIIDTSFLDDNVSALVIGLLARRILAARKLCTRKENASKFKDENVDQLLEADIPPTWLFIDEAHTLIPSGNVKTPASNAITEYVKQGRQPGCSLVFATQQPSAIDTKVLSQLDIIVAHKLVFDDDVKAVFKRTPTIIPKQYKAANFIKTLPVGTAMTGDRREETSRAFILKVRPRMSQHEGREAVTTERQKTSLSKDQVKKLAIEMVFSKLQQAGSIESSVVAQAIKTLDNKFKQTVSATEVLKELEKKGVKFDQKNSLLFIPGRTEEVEKEEIAEVEKEEAERAAREGRELPQAKPQAESAKAKPAAQAAAAQEELELVAFPVRLNEEKAMRIAETKLEKKFFGLLGTSERIKSVELKFEPIYHAIFQLANEKGEFVGSECFINSVSGEFFQFNGKNFIESKGANLLWNTPSEEVSLLRTMIGKRVISEGKTKNKLLDALVEKGFVEKNQQNNKIVFEVSKKIELPPNALHPLLKSVNNVPFTKTEVVSIEQPVFEKSAVPKLLAKVFAGAITKRIEEIYRPVFEVKIQSTEKTRYVKIDAMSGEIL